MPLMIESVNLGLFLYITSLSLLSAFSSVIIKPFLYLLCKPSKRVEELRSQIATHNCELAEIKMKDDFVTYARIQRKINKLDEELSEITRNSTAINFALKAGLRVGFEILLGLIMFGSFIWYRNEALFRFKPNFGPIQYVLGYPISDDNVISVHMWIVVSCFSMRLLIKGRLA